MQTQAIGTIPPNADTFGINRSVAPAAAPAAAPAIILDPVQPAAEVPNMGAVSEAVRNINKTMQALSQNLEFSIDTDSKRAIVKVVDQETKEVIRQMPTAEALEIAKALDRVQGLLIRQKA